MPCSGMCPHHTTCSGNKQTALMQLLIEGVSQARVRAESKVVSSDETSKCRENMFPGKLIHEQRETVEEHTCPWGQLPWTLDEPGGSSRRSQAQAFPPDAVFSLAGPARSLPSSPPWIIWSDGLEKFQAFGVWIRALWKSSRKCQPSMFCFQWRCVCVYVFYLNIK